MNSGKHREGTGRLVPFSLLLAAGLLALGCAECKADSDCSDDEICVKEKCVANTEDAGDTLDDTGRGTGTGTGARGSDPEVDTTSSSSRSDAGPGTDTTDDPGSTDSRPTGTDDDCNPIRDMGDPCARDCECMSGHCGDGFCCEGGECCASAGDCDRTRCVQYFCSGNNRCEYSESIFECGSQDREDGETCDDNLRCDGFGNCLEPAVVDCTPYTPTGAFSCEEGAVAPACHDSCTQDNVLTNCVEGAICFYESCRMLGGLDNGEACAADTDCRSGHCGDGFCCNDGECCQTVSDCDDSLCTNRACTDSECRYNLTGFWCGAEDDADGDLCRGDNRCNGYGDCISADLCDTGYAGNGEFNCDETTVVETCYTACVNITQCNDGFRCEGGECRAGTLANGAVCAADGECRSGNCGDGFCCPEGECCQEVSDCDDTLCNDRACGTNFQCDYSDAIPCGYEDTDGDTCTGDSRCDGHGGCMAVDPCVGPYASNGVFSCDVGRVSETCNTTCANLADCNRGYGCDGAVCVSLGPLPDGLACDDGSDCDSGYCEGNICCPSGECCASVNDCDDSECDQRSCSNGACVYFDIPCGSPDVLDGDTCTGDSLCDGQGACVVVDACDGAYASTDAYTCGAGIVTEACVVDCTGDLDCNPGFHCNAGVCSDALLNGEGTCAADADCASGNCTEATGICCAPGAGDCCNSAADCDDGNPCTEDRCNTSFQCDPLPLNENALCSDGDYCNGQERCDDSGNCLPGSPPCSDTPANTCTETTCHDCVRTSCDEVNDECVDTQINDGLPCTDPEYCIGDISRVCRAGICANPGTGTLPCAGATGNDCTEYTCDEQTDGCRETPLADGWDCDDGDPCNGENRCQGGVCVPGDLPCDDGDPCTTDPCTPNGETASCGTPTAISDGLPCNEQFACYGDAPTCYQGECVPSDAPCADDLGICTIHECIEIDYDDYECSAPISNTPFSLACDAATDLTGTNIFRTREYYSYNATCSGGYPGAEAVVALDTPVGGTVTVSVANVSPAMSIEILQLDSWCDPESCVAHGTDSLTATIGDGGAIFVLEASSPLPPDSLEVVVGACP